MDPFIVLSLQGLYHRCHIVHRFVMVILERTTIFCYQFNDEAIEYKNIKVLRNIGTLFNRLLKWL